MKRSRGRGRKPGNSPNKTFESNGPDVKIRGNANQIYDKYMQYARDAQTSGDRVAAENYQQHAEHYFRIMAASQPKERPRDDASDDAEDRDERETSEAGSDGERSSDGDGRRDGRSRDRNRDRDRNRNRDRDREQGDAKADPMAVVDDEETPAPVEASDDSAEPEKKPRRRTYRRKTDANGDGKADSAPAGDDRDDAAGLHAMMSRTGPSPVVSDTAVEPGDA